MSRRKLPKEPKAWKWPRLYGTFDVETPRNNPSALVIIYPDGRPAERTSSATQSFADGFAHTPCWLWGYDLTSPEAQRILMILWCDRNKVKRYFLGEIK